MNKSEGIEIDLAVRRELRFLEKSKLLHEEEILCEVELAMLRGNPGALIVTDLRVLFHRTTVIRRRTSVISIPLAEIVDVRRRVDSWLGRPYGVLELVRRAAGDDVSELTFERIPGGDARADEIAATIQRQRSALAHLGRHQTSSDSNVRPTHDEPADDEQSRLRVTLGRGVRSYVLERGGKLYVWGEPVGGFRRMRADTEAPDDVELVKLGAIADVELFVDRDLSRASKVRLARRRFFRPGVVVDTGAFLEG